LDREDSKLSQYSGQDYLRGLLNNFYDELEDEAREVEAGTLVQGPCFGAMVEIGRAWPATCYEALARTAESKVEEAEREAERMMQTIVRPPIRHVGPQGSARNAMEREPTEDDVDIEEPEEHLIWGRCQYFMMRH